MVDDDDAPKSPMSSLRFVLGYCYQSFLCSLLGLQYKILYSAKELQNFENLSAIISRDAATNIVSPLLLKKQ